jgi:hypothetical protein
MEVRHSMGGAIEIKKLNFPITMAYTAEDGEFCAAALQFDLVGVGKTREQALKKIFRESSPCTSPKC